MGGLLLLEWACKSLQITTTCVKIPATFSNPKFMCISKVLYTHLCTKITRLKVILQVEKNFAMKDFHNRMVTLMFYFLLWWFCAGCWDSSYERKNISVACGNSGRETLAYINSLKANQSNNAKNQPLLSTNDQTPKMAVRTFLLRTTQYYWP